jgi:hypothetical protein
MLADPGSPLRYQDTKALPRQQNTCDTFVQFVDKHESLKEGSAGYQGGTGASNVSEYSKKSKYSMSFFLVPDFCHCFLLEKNSNIVYT